VSANTKIEWTTHTFNAWWGCHKVSPACKNCYAEAFSKRTGNQVWGADAPRRFFGDKHWREPLKWNRDAEQAGERRRVFCGSMMDVFELHEDAEQFALMEQARVRLWRLIGETPWLDWLLLTKRPENARAVLPHPWWFEGCPNVWMGTTVENQEYADIRIPHLLKIKASVLFLSCEPLLGPIDIPIEYLAPFKDTDPFLRPTPRIGWVIAGGESGHHHREHQLEWSRSLRDQCQAAGVAFFFKQTGELATEETFFQAPLNVVPGRKRLELKSRSKGGALEEIPADLRVREFPAVAP
jgi:protein gp37